MSYQPGIPTGSVPLNQDYLNIQADFTQINDQFEVDHVPLTSTSGSPPNGYHTSVHLVPVSTTASNPPNNQPVVPRATTPGYGQVFNAQINDGISTDNTLFFLTGGGKLIQLTRNFVPMSSATNGYAFIGAFMFQWGSVATNFSVGTGTVTFSTSNLAFPNSCVNISTTMTGASTTANLVEIVSKNNTSFNWKFTGGSVATSYTGFMWMAIGF